ncbi:MAG: MmcQ/YjbR family DNA-binding protein [Candidatus Bipolaricaulota bacterium]|nr:MmcQ/YjbR family DNA-binding protein [Candidatus Bipolaricaulota bacterium]
MLRDMYTAVTLGYYINKRHWNTIILDEGIPDAEIEEMIDESYDLVVKRLTKTARKELEEAGAD